MPPLPVAGAVAVHRRGRVPARAAADQAVPHLAADLAARRVGAAQGGPARRRLRPPRRHGAARARYVSAQRADSIFLNSRLRQRATKLNSKAGRVGWAVSYLK